MPLAPMVAPFDLGAIALAPGAIAFDLGAIPFAPGAGRSPYPSSMSPYVSRSFVFKNFPVDVRGTCSTNT